MYPRKKIPRPLIISGVIVSIVVLVLLIGRLGILGWMMRGISIIIPPRPQPAWTAEEVNELRSRVGSLETENSILRERIIEEIAKRGIQEQEAVIGHKIIDAKIIYRDHARLFKSAIIDKGSADGVRVHMPVINSDGLVGRVVSTTSGVSRIELLSSPDCVFAVINTRSRDLALVRGSDTIQWDLTAGLDRSNEPPNILKLTYLSPSADISVQDSLVTSGISGVTPSGIRVGEVTEIIKLEEEGLYDIRVKPYADLDHIENVGVVLFSEEHYDETLDLMKEDSSTPIQPQ